MILQTFGQIQVLGADAPSSLSVLYVLAEVRRAMPDQLLAEWTGYRQSSIASNYTTSSDMVARSDGYLTVADGVWADHQWMLECAQRAMDAAGRQPDVAAEWVFEVFDLLATVEGAPYSTTPGGRSKDKWNWVDDYPPSSPARTNAELNAVESVDMAGAVWRRLDLSNRIPTSTLVDFITELTALIPYAPMKTGPSAEHLLMLAADVADPDREILERVLGAARRRIATGHLDPTPQLAERLGL